jgi:GNAT superfamily N-acetyltransferase
VTHDESSAIRVATVADADALARLRYLWRVGEDGGRGTGLQVFEREFADWMVEHGATHVPFLAELQGVPIGMAWLVVVDRVPGPQYFIRRSAYIQSFYVIASERSCGIGTLLMASVLEHAKDLGLDYIAVHPSERSFSLYGRLGFLESDHVLELPLRVRQSSLPVLPKP